MLYGFGSDGFGTTLLIRLISSRVNKNKGSRSGTTPDASHRAKTLPHNSKSPLFSISFLALTASPKTNLKDNPSEEFRNSVPTLRAHQRGFLWAVNHPRNCVLKPGLSNRKLLFRNCELFKRRFVKLDAETRTIR